MRAFQAWQRVHNVSLSLAEGTETQRRSVGKSGRWSLSLCLFYWLFWSFQIETHSWFSCIHLCVFCRTITSETVCGLLLQNHAIKARIIRFSIRYDKQKGFAHTHNDIIVQGPSYSLWRDIHLIIMRHKVALWTPEIHVTQISYPEGSSYLSWHIIHPTYCTTIQT